MEVLRSVWRSPATFRKKLKHKKVPEDQWGQAKEPIIEGVTFYLKFIGSTLVEELPEGDSYGDSVSPEAVKRIIQMAKSQGKKLHKACLTISSSGIEVIDLCQKYTLTKVCIYRISFCSADKHNDKVFTFIARNTENETMEAYAFLSESKKMSHAVAYTVSRAFYVADEIDKESETEKDHKETINQKKRESLQSDSSFTSDSSPRQQSVFMPPVEIHSADSSLASTSRGSSVDQSPLNSSRSVSSQDSNGKIPAITEKISLDFDLEDSFSQLAQMRICSKEGFQSSSLNPWGVLDPGVAEYMNGSQNVAEFKRQGSYDDLMNL